MQILSDVEVMRLRDIGAAWMSQEGRDALDDWLLGVQSPPIAPDTPAPAAPQAVQAPTEQAQQSHVMPPFAAPAGRRDAGTSVLSVEQILLTVCAHTGKRINLCNAELDEHIGFARAIEAEVVSRGRAQGGITNDESPAAPSSTEAREAAITPTPAVQESTKSLGGLSDEWINENLHSYFSYSGNRDNIMWAIVEDIHHFARAVEKEIAAPEARATAAEPVIEVSVAYADCQHVAPIKHVTRSDGRIAIVVQGLDTVTLDRTRATAPEVREAALRFVNEAVNCAFDGGGFDGGTIQELAERLGLLKKETMREPCGEGCRCAESVPFFPTECYRKTYLNALRTTSPSQAPASGTEGDAA
jgi:hypothetical protein